MERDIPVAIWRSRTTHSLRPAKNANGLFYWASENINRAKEGHHLGSVKESWTLDEKIGECYLVANDDLAVFLEEIRDGKISPDWEAHIPPTDLLADRIIGVINES